jgi:hypothetical protein
MSMNIWRMPSISSGGRWVATTYRLAACPQTIKVMKGEVVFSKQNKEKLSTHSCLAAKCAKQGNGM